MLAAFNILLVEVILFPEIPLRQPSTFPLVYGLGIYIGYVSAVIIAMRGYIGKKASTFG